MEGQPQSSIVSNTTALFNPDKVHINPAQPIGVGKNIKGMGEEGSIAPGQVFSDTKAMIENHQAETKFSGDINTDARINANSKDIITRDVAKDIKAHSALNSAEDNKTLQKYFDAKATGSKDVPKLSSRLQKQADTMVEMNKAANKADAAKFRAQGNESAARDAESRDPNSYVPRLVADKGTAREYFAQGDRKNPGSVNGFSGSRANLNNKRTIMAATDENGERHIVSVKNQAIRDSNGNVVKRINKQVIEFKDGKVDRTIGSLNLKTNEEQMSRELKPIDARIKSLTQEKNILSRNQGTTEAASKRLSNIEDELEGAQAQYQSTLDKYDSENLNNKSWKASDGHTYTFSPSSVEENTKEAGQKYFNTPYENVALNYRDAMHNLENVKFINNIKDNDAFDRFSSAPGETAPKGYKSVPEVPQLQGYKFDPGIAESIKAIATSSKDEADMWQGINHFLKQTIIYFPVKHDFNILENYLGSRPIYSYANPVATIRAIRSVGQAFLDVTRDSDYLRSLQKKGFTTLSGSGQDELEKAMKPTLDKMFTDEKITNNIGKAFGLPGKVIIQGYKKIQGISIGTAQDILNVAAVRERQMDTLLTKGEDLDTAMDKVSKTHFQYQIPSKVLGSANVAKTLKSPAFFFAEYGYDRFKIVGNELKTAINVVHPKASVEAMGQLASQAAITVIWGTLVDKGVRAALHNPNASVSAPGTGALFQDAYNAATGKKGLFQTGAGLVNVTPEVTAGVELYNNTNYNGEPIVNNYQSGAQNVKNIGVFLANQLSPVQKIDAMSKSPTANFLSWTLSLAGASSPKDSPQLENYYSIYYNQGSQAYDQFKGAVQAGDMSAAMKTANDYNNALVKAGAEASGLSESQVRSSLSTNKYSPFIDTSQRGILEAKKPSKTLKQSLSTNY